MFDAGRAVSAIRHLITVATGAAVLVTLLAAVILLAARDGGAFHAQIHDLQTTAAGFTVSGALADDQLGWIVASGDFNGDGIDDFLITARLADPLGRAEAGEAYVFFGPRTGAIDLAQCPGDPNHCADVVIQGAEVGDHLGFSAAAGNFNGDAYDDILVASWRGAGAGNLRPLSGEAYVVLGSPSLGGTVDTQAGEQDFTIYGAASDDRVGVAAAAGDVNGDGYDDILLGSTSADPGGRVDAGEAYVVFGAAVLSGSALVLSLLAAMVFFHLAIPFRELRTVAGWFLLVGAVVVSILVASHRRNGPSAPPARALAPGRTMSRRNGRNKRHRRSQPFWRP